MPDTQGHSLDEDMLQCIEVCMDCHKACLQTIPYCLQQGGLHSEPNHIRLMMDCAEICQTAANFMIRGSDLHQHTCAACAEVCSGARPTAHAWPTTRAWLRAPRCAGGARNSAGGWHTRWHDALGR